MSQRTIVITEGDRRRLTYLLTSEFTEAIQSKAYLTDLRSELRRAEIVDAADVPGDVVTMNSTVRLRDIDTGELETYTLVFPHEANITCNKLSVLAPIGSAMLGNHVGDILQWRVAGGGRRLRVEEVRYQAARENAF